MARGRGRLGGGYVRKDILRTCPACGRELRPCNLLRHLKAQHPDHERTAELEHERATRSIRQALGFD